MYNPREKFLQNPTLSPYYEDRRGRPSLLGVSPFAFSQPPGGDRVMTGSTASDAARDSYAAVPWDLVRDQRWFYAVFRLRIRIRGWFSPWLFFQRPMPRSPTWIHGRRLVWPAEEEEEARWWRVAIRRMQGCVKRDWVWDLIFTYLVLQLNSFMPAGSSRWQYI